MSRWEDRWATASLAVLALALAVAVGCALAIMIATTTRIVSGDDEPPQTVTYYAPAVGGTGGQRP